jgi:brefeldin A-inhibited guanine nucleotide-exchange protein
MLHTDAHNPNVKEKFTKDGWIHNNDKIDDGKDLPYDYLSQLYDRIGKHKKYDIISYQNVFEKPFSS